MTCVSIDEYHAGWRAFSRAIGGYSVGHNTLNQYLGEHPEYFPMEMPPFYEMSEKAYQRLQLILGPHGHTICKAWLAQHPVTSVEMPK